MKKQFFLITVLLFSFLYVNGQNFPKGMKYQAVARDNSGVILSEQSINLKITLFSLDERNVKEVSYIETHETVTNQLGLFSLTIGQGKIENGMFDEIPWSMEEIWMAIDIDTKGGQNFTSISESKLLAVPYAIHALSASEIRGGGLNKFAAGEVWEIGGNIFKPDQERTLGSIEAEDIFIITSNETRITVKADGDVEIVNDLDVDGQSTTGTLISEGNVTLNSISGVTTIEGQTTLNNKISVNGSSTFNNEVNIIAPLNVDGDAIIKQSTLIHSDLAVGGNVDLNIYGNGNTNISGATNIENNLDVDNNVSLNNNSGVTQINGATTIDDNFNVNQNVVLNELGGTTTIKGETTIDDNFNVNQNVVLNELGGTTTIKGETTIDDNFNVNQNVVLNELGGTTVIKGATTFEGPSLLNSLEVQNGVMLNELGGTTTIKGATTIENSLEVDGTSTFKSRAIFDINVSGDQTVQASYPVLIKGSKQGLAIELTPAVNDETQSHRGNNYISFWRGGVPKGRIEGMGRADLDPSGLCALFVDMINTPPPALASLGTSYDPFSAGMPDDITNLMQFTTGGLPNFTQVLGLSGLMNKGSLPNFTQDLGLSTLFSPGGLPSLNSGSLPSISVTGGDFVGCTTPIVCDPITGPSFPSISFNPGGLPSLLSGALPSISNFNLNTILNKGALPSISDFDLNGIFNKGTLPGLNFLSIEGYVNFSNPFITGSYNQYCGFISNYNGTLPTSPANAMWTSIKSSLMNSGMYPADPQNFESQIFSNYTLDIIQQGISTMNQVVTFSSSVTSLLDPEDVFSEAVDMVVEITSLTIYGAYADLNLGVAYESGAGDYAEWLMRVDPEEVISKGDVVGVIGGKVSKKFTHADRFMVVSTAPLLLGNMPDNLQDEQLHEKIAFMGQVPVKIQGEVNIGDYILPSGTGDGLGIAVAPEDMLARDYQRIVGVAWENGDPSKFINLINTAVGVNHNDMAKVVEQMQFTLNHIQDAIKKIDPSFVSHDYEVSQKMYQEVALDYNVSATHKNNVSTYFSDKTYSSREEMLEDVKKALVSQAGINLDEMPLIKYILENPEKAEGLTNYYSSILDDMVSVRKNINDSMSE